MISITLAQNRKINSDSSYGVNTQVTAASGIDINVFVYAFGTSIYNRPATIGDMSNYPPTPTQGVPWYRHAGVTQNFTDIQSAIAAANTHLTSIQSLVAAYGTAITSFVGSDSTTYTS